MARGMSGQFSWRTVFRLPAFLIVNIAIVIALTFSMTRETYRSWSVDREISSLEAEAEQLEGRRTRLESLTKQLLSEEHVELEARSRLGRQKPGERVVVLYGLSSTGTWTGEDVFGDIQPVRVSVEDLRSNPQKWWDYFSKQRS